VDIIYIKVSDSSNVQNMIHKGKDPQVGYNT